MKNSKKEVIITGGSHGLGYALTEKLLKYGYKVVNFDKKKPKKEIKSNFYKYEKIDTRNYKEIEKRKSKFEPDILINNASINYIEYITDTNLDKFNSVIKTNINGYFNTVKAFLPDLINNSGTVLNIVSRAAKRPMTASLSYNLTKSAQLMMTQQMAREFSKEDYGVTVFAISPGKIKETMMSKYVDKRVPEVRGWTKEKSKKYWENEALMPHKIDKQKLSEQIISILSKQHDYMTGSNLEMGIE